MTMNVQIRVLKDRLTGILRDAPISLKSEVANRCAPMAYDMAETASQKIHSRTGRLAGSIIGRVIETPQGISLQLRSEGVDYARIIEEGGITPPHEIVPISAKALAWTSIGLGKQSGHGLAAFAASVKHPGGRIQGQHPLKKTIEEYLNPFKSAVKESALIALGGSNAPST